MPRNSFVFVIFVMLAALVLFSSNRHGSASTTLSLASLFNMVEKHALYPSGRFRDAALQRIGCTAYHRDEGIDACVRAQSTNWGVSERLVTETALEAAIPTLQGDKYARLYEEYVAPTTYEFVPTAKEIVLVIRVGSFDEPTAAQVVRAVHEFKYDRIVLVLHSLGGAVNYAATILDQFISKGRLVELKGRHYSQSFIATRDRLAAEDERLPVYVLVSGDTASAAEVTAYVLKQRRRNVCSVGSETYGKGVFQLVFGNMLAVTVGHSVLPDGSMHDGRPFVPDVYIRDEEEALRFALTADECRPSS